MKPLELSFGYYFLIVLSATLALMPKINAQQSITELTFKGTHNSYACCGGFGHNTCPVMHNSPAEQIEDWGVWEIELDFDIVVEGPENDTVLIVGHDGQASDDTWTHSAWGRTLADFLYSVRATRSYSYRPVFIYLERKKWGHFDAIPAARFIDTTLVSVFGRDHIFGPEALNKRGNWPSVPELDSMVIPVAITNDNNLANSTDLVFLDNADVITRTPPPHGGPDSYVEESDLVSVCDSGRIIDCDQYQMDWTFSPCATSAPPNPVCVSRHPLPFFTVVNTIGQYCYMTIDLNTPCADPTDPSCPFFVSEHGTFKFPYGSLSTAVGKISDFPGWTILMKSGIYPEALTIDKPMKLEADGGTVTIGRLGK